MKDGRTKAVVIISDGMRYEIAHEPLPSRIRSEDRLMHRCRRCFGSLPSYTQLGMASLLPHLTLELDPEGATGACRREAHRRHPEPRQDPPGG